MNIDEEEWEEEQANGYEIENYNSLGLFENGTCTECCWYYDSKFEVGV